jgi:hypothetical protein
MQGFPYGVHNTEYLRRGTQQGIYGSPSAKRVAIVFPETKREPMAHPRIFGHVKELIVHVQRDHAAHRFGVAAKLDLASDRLSPSCVGRIEER